MTEEPGRTQSRTQLSDQPCTVAPSRASLVSSGYDSAPTLLGAWVSSLLRELRFHRPHGMAKKRGGVNKKYNKIFLK